MDQVIVTKFECITEPDRAFRLFLTTPRLLQLTQHSIGHLLADATYKLIQEDYPVLTIGTTDRDKRFHPLGLSVSMNEQQIDFRFMFQSLKEAAALSGIQYNPDSLVADDAGAITNGFSCVFNLNKVI